MNRGWAPLKGLIRGRKKYIDLPQQELYDLATDAAESRNLAASAREELADLRRRLDRLPSGIAPAGPVSSEEARKLRSLGYLAGGGTARQQGGASAPDPKTLVAVDGNLQRINVLSQTGRQPEAVALARSVVAENPDLVPAYQQLAALLRDSGEPARAAEVLEGAAARGIRDDSLDRLRALALCDSGKPNDAVALLERDAGRADADTLDTLGIALSRAGRGHEALAAFHRAIAADPRDALSHLNLGVALLTLGRPDEARASLEQALAVSDRNPRAWNALGVAWIRLGQPRQALEAWRRALAQDPRQYDALTIQALCPPRSATAPRPAKRSAASWPTLPHLVSRQSFETPDRSCKIAEANDLEVQIGSHQRRTARRISATFDSSL